MIAVNLTLGSQIVAARLQSLTKCPRLHRRGLTNFTKGGRLSLPRARPHRLGESHCGVGVRGTDLSRSGQRCIDASCLRKFNWGAMGPARIRAAASENDLNWPSPVAQALLSQAVKGAGVATPERALSLFVVQWAAGVGLMLGLGSGRRHRGHEREREYYVVDHRLG